MGFTEENVRERNLKQWRDLETVLPSFTGFSIILPMKRRGHKREPANGILIGLLSGFEPV